MGVDDLFGDVRDVADVSGAAGAGVGEFQSGPDNLVPQGTTEKRAVGPLTAGGLLSFLANKGGACEARPSSHTESKDSDDIIYMTEETRKAVEVFFLEQTSASSPSAW